MSPQEYPVDARGGDLWDKQFLVPVYPNTTGNVTWHYITDNIVYLSESNSTASVLFGACLVTLIHVIVFTPPVKRGRKFFMCLVAGLFFATIRQFTEIWNSSRGGYGMPYSYLIDYPNTAYGHSNASAGYSTLDAYTNASLGSSVNDTINEISAFLTLIAVQACFFIQAHAVLAVLRKNIHYTILIICSVLGLVGTLCRLVQAVWVEVNTYHLNTKWEPAAFDNATASLIAASIVAWCLVFAFQVSMQILNQLRLGTFRRNSMFQIMLMISIETMVAPVIFVALQYRPPGNFPEAELCVLPSILILIPFGSIWCRSFELDANARSNLGHPGRYEGHSSVRGILDGSTNVASSASRPGSSVTAPKRNSSTPHDPFHTPRHMSDADNAMPTRTSHPLDANYTDQELEEGIKVRNQFMAQSAPRASSRYSGGEEQV